MKKGKCKKLLAVLLCAAILLADLASARILSLAAEAETVQETEVLTDIDENVSSESETENTVESVQIQGTENLENDTETENQTQKESVSENVEIVETVETETIAEDISESEVEEAETQVVLDADGNIASGVIDEDYGHITWVIDANGKLTVEGTGDFSSKFGQAPWCNNYSIKSAEINVTGMTDASGMFSQCGNLESVDLSKFDTSKLTNMSDMFFRCYKLTTADLSNFDTSHVTDMSSLFRYCEN